ncbi:tyrosine-type recombinase/integrase [Marimonas sp. MJW-29]|uniref:Tyrosine-type recombinase/integrase n=2 Tax=Sulfitobacter sediminis TaxID=3234186 RepID=A0ABV3RN16_9RHOB
MLDRFVVEAWEPREIHSITKGDIIDLLDSIVDSGRKTTANRVRSYLSKFFNWCTERGIIDHSPMIGVRAPTKERARDRVLTDDEIRWFWASCERVGPPWEAPAKLMLLTGQRRSEVIDMTEAEIAGDIWRLSAERTKNGRAHEVPLSGPSRDVLDGVLRICGARGYLHTTTGNKPVSGLSKARNHLARQMEEVAFEEVGESIEIPHWTFHDLRRTAATGMARLGIPVRVTEAVLNHVSGTGGGIVAVYQRHDFADEKREALEKWAEFVTALVGDA